MTSRNVAAGALVAVALVVPSLPPDQVPGVPFRAEVVRAAQPERPAVLVNPRAGGNGTANTIQGGIDIAEPGGKVLVLPGTYPERLAVTKGVTIEAIGGGRGDVIVSPPGAPDSTIEILTTEPVVLRDLTVLVPGTNGIRGVGPVDLTVESSRVLAVNPPPGLSVLILVSHHAADGTRARMVVRDTMIDGTIPNVTPPPPVQSFGVRPEGDVDSLVERNVIRRMGGACIFTVTRADLAGELNVDILGNDLDECHPIGRAAAILVGPLAANQPTAARPLRATGVVNIIGNTLRNSTGHCLNNAIGYEVYTGRIERNTIVDFVQPCATGIGRSRPSAIWIGRVTPPVTMFPFPPVTPSVRFNDIVGNAQAGLRIGANQTIAIDASCNYWGAESGPSGAGAGAGDAVVVEAGGAMPFFTPFAAAPIAGESQGGC